MKELLQINNKGHLVIYGLVQKKNLNITYDAIILTIF